VPIVVIEIFRNHDVRAIYGRLRERGQQMPEGLAFIDSWVSADIGRCVQLIETSEGRLLPYWILEWSDFMSFEIVPVMQSRQTAIVLGVTV
jgi:hypothetical protein